ncbi:MAG: hypothetical protein R3C03_11940 [Pirellulaceae bacterium]
MAVRIQCPSCKNNLDIPTNFIGKLVQCGICSQQVHVGAPAKPKKAKGRPSRKLQDPFDVVQKPIAPEPPPVADFSGSFVEPVRPLTPDQLLLKNVVVFALSALGVLAIIFTALIVLNPMKKAEAETSIAQSAGPSGQSPSGLANSSGGSEAVADRPEFIMPKLPDMIETDLLPQFNTVVYLADFGKSDSSSGDKPGGRMKIRIYLPSPDRSNKEFTKVREEPLPEKLPCVLLPPSGGELLHGVELDDKRYFDEIVPFIAHDMIVVHFSVDGAIPPKHTSFGFAKWSAIVKSFEAYSNSEAGLANARIAFEYARTKIKQVDQSRIYIAGHNSAGNLALRLAEVESRLAGCLALSPLFVPLQPLDGEGSHVLLQADRDRIQGLLDETDATKKIENITCPVFIFHSRVDEITPVSHSQYFANALRTYGKNVTYNQAEEGNHYNSLVDTGLIAAIGWIWEQEYQRGLRERPKLDEEFFRLNQQGSGLDQ